MTEARLKTILSTLEEIKQLNNDLETLSKLKNWWGLEIADPNGNDYLKINDKELLTKLFDVIEYSFTKKLEKKTKEFELL